MIVSMFEHMSFDVEIERDVDVSRLRWPGAVSAEHSFGGNQDFHDLSGMSWSQAEDLLTEEKGFIARIEQADDPDDEYEAIDEEMYEDPDVLMGLDIGVASTVGALSAAGCFPFASCNAGALGGAHHEEHPVVAFCAQARHIPLLIAAADAIDVGLENYASGEMIVYADDIRKLPAFANAVIKRRVAFDDVNALGRNTERFVTRS